MTLTTTPVDIVRRAEMSGAPGVLGRHPSWPRVPVGQLARVVNGAPFPSRLFNNSGDGLPLVRIRDVGVDKPITYYRGDYDEIHRVTAGDILIGMDGDFRVARWRGPDSLLNQRVCRLDLKTKDVDARWLLHSLQGYLDAIWQETSSVTVKHLSSKAVTQIPLPLPPIEEQRRIVELLEDHLSRLDAASANLGAARRRLAALRRSELHALAVGPPAALGDLALESGYGTSTKCTEGGAGAAVVRIPNLVDGRIDLADEKRATNPTVDLQHLMLKPGDLLIVRTNGSRELIGRSAVVQPGISAAFASYLIRFRVDESRVRPEWVRLMLESPTARVVLEGLSASSAGQYNLGLAKLKGVTVPCPDLSTQDALLSDAIAASGARARLAVALGNADQHRTALKRSLTGAAFAGCLAGALQAPGGPDG